MTRSSAVFTVLENSLIGCAGYETELVADVVWLPEATFDALRQLTYGSAETDDLLTFVVRKGREYIRVGSYVGLLAMANGTQLEILPKVGGEEVGRAALLAMLQYLRHSPFRTFSQARTRAAELPLHEVFVSAFLDTLAPLMQQGIQQTYVTTERHERFWKGRFQATRHQRDNACHAERIAVSYDRLTPDVAANRLLKTTLAYLQFRTNRLSSQQRIRQFIAAFDNVSLSGSVPDDLAAVRQLNRLFTRYEPALRWAEALLAGQAYGVRSGAKPGLSLLFPINRVFEDYVAHGIRAYWPDAGNVAVQESSAHLIDEHAGTPRFKLRPDMLIRHNDRTLVLDTKWKIINAHEPVGSTYGIEQADLYQLYAYGKKYSASDVFLIYPASNRFRQPLDVFGYDASTRLHVVPFDPLQPLAQEVEKLAQYALRY